MTDCPAGDRTFPVVSPRLRGGYTREQRAEPRTQRELRALFRQYTEAACLTLASIAGNPATNAAVRVMACKVILDRAWGAAPPGPTQAPADDEPDARVARPMSEADLASMDEAQLAQVLMEEVGRR